MLAGTLVNQKASTIAGQAGAFNDNVEWELASGKRAFLLERPVVSQAAGYTLDQIMRSDSILTPELTGHFVSGRAVREYEVEGSGLIQISGGQLLSATTAAGTEVTSLNGKVAARTDAATQELLGWVRGQLAPKDAGNFRLLIEVVAI